MITAVFCFLALIAGNANSQDRDNRFKTDLIAGQHDDVGSISVWNDSQYLYVKFKTRWGVRLTESHLHVATGLDGIPQTKKGNPIPGQFDHKTDHCFWVRKYTYKIPLESGWTPGTELFIAGHAEVFMWWLGNCCRFESAWGEGDDFPGKNWAMYFKYTVTCDDSKGNGFKNPGGEEGESE